MYTTPKTDNKVISSICILGGGTSGFVTAAILSEYFKNIKIKCVYSSSIGRIGVGESTQLAINDVFQFLRLRDKDWMPKCNATYKTNIKFEGWSDADFFYPFGDLTGDDVSDFFILTHLFPEIKFNQFSRFHRYHSRFAELNRFTDEGWDFHELTAYHFDTDKLSKVFYDVCLENGVEFVDDKYIRADKSDDGNIASIKCENGTHEADLFVDCTGFHSELLGKVMGVPYKSYANTLINHRAVAAKIPYTDKNQQLTSYTNNVTMDNGWCYEIPLWDGMSVGYVHSLKFTTPEKVDQEFIDRYGVEPTKGVEFRTGRYEKAWVKNVASVGLSFGFIEPLEATGLASIVTNVFRLLESLSTHLSPNSFDREVFNHACATELDNSKTFIDMHYASSHKSDTEYWKYVTNIDYPWNQYSCGRSIEMLTGDRDFSNKKANGGLSFILAGNGYSPHSPAFIQKMGDKNYYMELKDKILEEDYNLNRKVLEYPTTAEFLKTHIYS